MMIMDYHPGQPTYINMSTVRGLRMRNLRPIIIWLEVSSASLLQSAVIQSLLALQRIVMMACTQDQHIYMFCPVGNGYNRQS